MEKKTSELSVRSKIWLADEAGAVVFGLGRLKMLDAIHRRGSIQAAARELGMSYRGLWGRIKATEQRLGKPLLHCNIGGKKGGGSELTPFALDLMARFKKLHRQVAADADDLFEVLIQPGVEERKGSSR